MPSYLAKPHRSPLWRGRRVRRPVGFWGMTDQGPTTCADWLGVINGTYTNGPTPAIGGYGRERLFVTGSDQYVTLGNPPALQITADLTLAAWYKLNSIPPSDPGSYQLLSKDNNTGGRAYTLEVQRNTTTTVDAGVRFYINGGGTRGTPGGSDPSWNKATENRVAVAGDDRLVVATYQKATGRFTLDIFDSAGASTSISFTGTTGGINTATADALIGRRRFATATQPFDGIIRLAAVWNVALEPAEVQAFGADPFAEFRPPSLRYFLMLPTTTAGRLRRINLNGGVPDYAGLAT